MKNILTVITVIFLLGCSINISAKSNITAVDKKYKNIKNAIKTKCAGDAKYLKFITEQRDADVSKDDVIDWILETAKFLPGIKTEDVLNQVLLALVIYSHPNMTPDEVYEQYDNHCVETYFKRFNRMYEYEKQQLK